MSVGLGDAANEVELLSCFGAISGGDKKPGGLCPWFDTPAAPRSQRAAERASAKARASWRALARRPAIHGQICERYGDHRARGCAPKGTTR
jgi:hypothetical protein